MYVFCSLYCYVQCPCSLVLGLGLFKVKVHKWLALSKRWGGVFSHLHDYLMRFISEKALCFGLPPHHSQLPMPRSRTSAFGRRTKKSRAQSTAAALAPTLSDAATTAATWPDAVSSERAAEIAPAPHPTTSRPLAAKGGRATEPPAVASPDADASPAPAAAASRSKCASPEAPTSPEALTSDLKTRLLERKHAEKELKEASTPFLFFPIRCLSLTHPFFPYVTPHSSHISPTIFVWLEQHREARKGDRRRKGGSDL